MNMNLMKKVHECNRYIGHLIFLLSGKNAYLISPQPVFHRRGLQVYPPSVWGVVRWCWVNFQCRGILQFGYSWARAYCARSRCGWGLFGHFYSHLSFLSSFSLSLGDGPI